MNSEQTQETSLHQYLHTMEQMYRMNRPPHWQAVCTEALFTKYGVPFEVTGGKDPIYHTPKECYRNAFLKAQSSEGKLIYVEGYAVMTDFGIPFQHAWVCDKDGKAFDPTLGSGGATEYLGIPFNQSWLERVTNRSGYYGVFGEMILPWQVSWYEKGQLPTRAIYEIKRNPGRVLGANPSIPQEA